MNRKPYVCISNVQDTGYSEEYKKILQLIIDLGIDPFTKEYLTDPRFGQKEILYESDHWIVFKNQYQYRDTSLHFIFVSKEYGESITDFSPEIQLDFFSIFKKICEKFNIEGGGLSLRFGNPKISGATVQHFHAQLVVPEDKKVVAVYYGSK